MGWINHSTCLRTTFSGPTFRLSFHPLHFCQETTNSHHHLGLHLQAGILDTLPLTIPISWPESHSSPSSDARDSCHQPHSSLHPVLYSPSPGQGPKLTLSTQPTLATCLSTTCPLLAFWKMPRASILYVQSLDSHYQLHCNTWSNLSLLLFRCGSQTHIVNYTGASCLRKSPECLPWTFEGQF